MTYDTKRIYCVGRNYRDHAIEMGDDPDRQPPFFFTKPADALVPASGEVPYPRATQQLEYEVELLVKLSKGGVDISASDALDHVWGYGVGVDLTRRDLQQQAKDARRPWDAAKSFEASAPVGQLLPVAQVGHPSSGRIWLEVDGELKQQGDLAEQIWQVADVIAFASQLWRLHPGDLIMTGTPAGVGPIERGQTLRAGIDGLPAIEFRIGK